MSRNGRQRPLPIPAQFILKDEHSVDIVLPHGRADGGGHGAQVLSDDQRFAALGFQSQNGVELLGAVVDIGPVTGGCALRNPEQAMQSHHVVEAENRGTFQVVPKGGDKATVSFPPDALGMERRKSPVLSLREESIRGRAGRGAEGETLPLAPNVVPVAMDAQRKVQIEVRAAPPHRLRNRSHLIVGLPLDKPVIGFRMRFEVALLQNPVPERAWPPRPGLAKSVGDGAEARIGLGVRFCF